MTKGYDLQQVCVLCGANHDCSETDCLRNYRFAPTSYRLCACGYRHDPGPARCPRLGSPPQWMAGPNSTDPSAPLPAPLARRGTIYDALVAENRRAALAIPPSPPDAVSVSNETEAALHIIAAGLVQSTGLWSHSLIPGCYYASRQRALAEAFKVYIDDAR
jgi:hypothetical protein